jgi:hypothetical protein
VHGGDELVEDLQEGSIVAGRVQQSQTESDRVRQSQAESSRGRYRGGSEVGTEVGDKAAVRQGVDQRSLTN